MYILIILITAVLLLAMAVVIMYIRVTRKYVNLRTAGVGDKDETIIGNAKVIAEKIIEESKVKSKLMLDQSQNLSGKYEEYIETYIKDATNKYLKSYAEFLQDSEKKLLEGFAHIAEGVNATVDKDIVEVRQSLSDQLSKMQKDIDAEVNKTYSSLEMDLTSYKKMRLKQIDTAIFDVIEEVARKVLAKEISAEEHEKLVMKALEEAKSQNVFFSSNEN